MNDRSDQSIKDLVISYSAYMTAIKNRVDHAIFTWAYCLIDDQDRTGVELIPKSSLQEAIERRRDCLEEVY